MNAKKNIIGLVTFLSLTLSLSAQMVDRTDYGGIITASSQIHESESKEMAFDNDVNTKWLTSFTATGWIEFQFPVGNQYAITSYSISSANDAPERDPGSWTLYGSNDNINWDVVDTRTGQSWDQRFSRREFECASPNAYNSYLLDITSNNGSSNLTGFSEMELLEEVLLAYSPNPADQSQNNSYEEVVLSWNAPDGTANATYKVYLDDDLSAVSLGDSSAFRGTVSQTNFSVSDIQPFTDYYWRVDVNYNDTTYNGNIWKFQTVPLDTDCLFMSEDFNGDCIVSIADLYVIASQWLDSACNTPPCADLNNSGRVELADLAVFALQWLEESPNVIISEIVAENDSVLYDKDGDDSDWIEIRNLSDVPVNLAGWSLSDDSANLAMWVFPDVTIPAKGYLVVFASEKNIVSPTTELHTNFRLDNAGEYLALVKPDGTISHSFSPAFPALGSNEAYGMTYLPGENSLIAAHLLTPTPGSVNDKAVIPDKPIFSRVSGTYTAPFNLGLTSDMPDSQIRYTLDGSIPTEISALYAAPLTISQTTRIRARVFYPTLLPGPVSTRDYLFLAEDLQNFSSNLPVIVVENFGAGDVPGSTSSVVELQPISLAVFEPNSLGVNQIINGPTMVSKAGIKERGRSSFYTPKDNYRLEFWDENNTDTDRSLLGMSADADWILHAPYNFDRTLMRNALIHQLSNEAGRYAVKTRFVELFVNQNGGDLSYADDYVGVYVLMEKIKRDNNRVNITKLGASDIAEPELTGGYILSIDSVDPGDSGFLSDRGLPSDPSSVYTYAEPKEEEIAFSQSEYIRQYINDFEDVLYGPDFADPAIGYRQFIETDSFIDHNLLNVLAKNVDALRLSTYFYKDRSSMLNMGPIWDFDRSMDSYDGRDDAYDTWSGTSDATKYFDYDWWSRLFLDPEFRLAYADRWYELREGPFATANIYSILDSMKLQLQDAQARNFARWTEVAPGYGGWEGEVDHLKQWLEQRAGWIDSQMAVDFVPAPPDFDTSGGYVNKDHVVNISISLGQPYVDVELVGQGTAVSIHIPTDNSLGTTWTDSSFVPDASWIDGTTGVGYERGTGYEALIQTDVEAQMYRNSTSALCRVEFDHDGSDVSGMALHMKYDDGFVAYINGTEVCRSSNISNDIPGDASAANHEAGVDYEVFDISSFTSLLMQGNNVLAVHAINANDSSSDFVVLPKLTA